MRPLVLWPHFLFNIKCFNRGKLLYQVYNYRTYDFNCQ